MSDWEHFRLEFNTVNDPFMKWTATSTEPEVYEGNGPTPLDALADLAIKLHIALMTAEARIP